MRQARVEVNIIRTVYIAQFAQAPRQVDLAGVEGCAGGGVAVGKGEAVPVVEGHRTPGKIVDRAGCLGPLVGTGQTHLMLRGLTGGGTSENEVGVVGVPSRVLGAGVGEVTRYDEIVPRPRRNITVWADRQVVELVGGRVAEVCAIIDEIAGVGNRGFMDIERAFVGDIAINNMPPPAADIERACVVQECRWISRLKPCTLQVHSSRIGEGSCVDELASISKIQDATCLIN